MISSTDRAAPSARPANSPVGPAPPIAWFAPEIDRLTEHPLGSGRISRRHGTADPLRARKAAPWRTTASIVRPADGAPPLRRRSTRPDRAPDGRLRTPACAQRRERPATRADDRFCRLHGARRASASATMQASLLPGRTSGVPPARPRLGGQAGPARSVGETCVCAAGLRSGGTTPRPDAGLKCSSALVAQLLELMGQDARQQPRAGHDDQAQLLKKPEGVKLEPVFCNPSIDEAVEL